MQDRAHPISITDSNLPLAYDTSHSRSGDKPWDLTSKVLDPVGCVEGWRSVGKGIGRNIKRDGSELLFVLLKIYEKKAQSQGSTGL